MSREGLNSFFIEHSWEMGIAFDRNGRIFYANPAAVQALAWEQLEGVLIVEVFPNCHQIALPFS